jgi:hypothetical protein
MNFSSPQVDVIGNRPLPSSFQGVAAQRRAGTTWPSTWPPSIAIRRVPNKASVSSEPNTPTASLKADHIYTGGITYTPFASLTTSLWATQAEDLWNQYYFGATHVLGDSQVLSLTTGLNYYKTQEPVKR